MADDTPLAWRWSENWSGNAMRIRGTLHERVCNARIALVGAGALGSALGEMLVREGVSDMTIYDLESFEIGNLRRHVLTMDDVTKNKATALAERLNGVCGVQLGSSYRSDLAPVSEAEIVIDCTANEDVIAALAQVLNRGQDRWFFKGAFGLDADRLFLYSEHGRGIDVARYHAHMAAPLAEERKKIADRGLNEMQPTGCWNPVFPGRWSQIQVRASEMLKEIEATLASDAALDNKFSIIPSNAA
jgi:hypothetical protein